MDDDTTETDSDAGRPGDGGAAGDAVPGKRPAPISWPPPAARRAELEAMIAASGLSTGAFLTEAVFGRTRHRPAELAKLAEILRECQDMADSLRAIARRDGGEVAISEIRNTMPEIRSALFLLM
ncbi:MAG: hypothetical protein AAFW01_16255, partial [Pseudomonadota bacterium]